MSGLEPGDYSEKVVINNNSDNQKYILNFNLKVSALGLYGAYNDGELIQTKFSKKRNEVIVLTKAPNRLLFFTANVNAPEIIELDRVPQCLALSTDENQIVVGYSNSEISTYDAHSKQIQTTFTLNEIPTSIEFGDENWLYYLADHTYGKHLHSLNFTDGSGKRSVEGNGGVDLLTKVPGKKLLLATRPGWSPDGVFIFDISTPGETDSLNLYHLSTMGVWPSDDGEKFFTGYKKIYRLPDFKTGQSFFAEHPPLIGELDVNYTQVVDFIAHQSSSGRIFTATTFGWSGENLMISIFNDKTLVKEKTVELQFDRPEGYSMGNTWWGRPVALYPAADNQLWSVQRFPGKSNNDSDIWSVVKVDYSK